ncbi:hypothetical protein [Clostridium sp. D33t1_170424_F3]|uniref:hypothetical protein n=1 Tax=Clostridium sp. D33t1_170424_F3 TaxID=2787099 RepID=UPI0018A9D013|nr:hypothetical protein [Clostridium sp. D33t1_170424_F3]
MTYTRPNGDRVEVSDAYQVDIVPDIIEAGSRAEPGIQTGWFPARPRYPAAVFYLLSSVLGDYVSNEARSVSFTYYFEVRALDERGKEVTARNLSSALSGIYSARRSQYDDSFEATTGTYIKRITFTFKVKLGE